MASASEPAPGRFEHVPVTACGINLQFLGIGRTGRAEHEAIEAFQRYAPDDCLRAAVF